MIYKCNHCNKDVFYSAGAKYCPVCGGKIQKVNIEKRIADMYNSGNTPKQIATNLKVNNFLVSRMLSKAAANGKISVDGLIQTEYGDAINNIMNDNWDGKTKTIKNSMPDDCTYITIDYYVAKRRKEETTKRYDMAISMIRKGIPVDDITEATKINIYNVERLMVQEIAKDKSIADPYIDPVYEDQVMAIVNSSDWDKKLTTIKNTLPEASYTCIKAIVTKYRK